LEYVVTQTNYDVVIVGGAAVGSAIAYFLTHDLGFGGTIAIIERDPSYTHASTTLSAASIRQQFSTPENIRMSTFGVAFIKGLRERFGDDADIGFREGGYLLLASEAGAVIAYENHDVQIKEKADIALLRPEEIKQRFPWLNTDGVVLGTFGRSGEGWFDSHALLTLLRQAARARGAHYIHDEVTALSRTGDRMTGVTLRSGQSIGCGTLVIAAGPQAGDVAAMADVALPVEPRKRCVFVVNCRTPLPGMPLIVDTSGVWIRPEGQTFICGISPEAANDPRADSDFTLEESIFHDVVWPALAGRIPAMEAIKLMRGWAGHYDYNTLDQNAVIGPHPQIGNLLFANGFSGHGLQQAPATGRAIAELITHGRFVKLDLSVFGYERIAAGRPLFERNII
jgi:glycine/D-amino acid oxidase-like deaminating enzyme